jgi:FMN phosphatase YigB (HAD superfamily)
MSSQPTKGINMPIKTIIFDLGGVIINLDYNKTIEAFRALGATNIDSVYNPASQSPLFDQFEIGNISPPEFRAGLKQALDINYVTDEEFDHAWNAMLLDIPPSHLETVKSLKWQGYNVFLFSNTNKIHHDALTRICERDIDQDLFPGCFDKEYYSFLFQQRKPHPEAFQTILNENGLLAAQTLFIDDSLKNIQGAKEAGLYTFYFTKDRKMYDFTSHLTSLELVLATKDVDSSNSCKCIML